MKQTKQQRDAQYQAWIQAGNVGTMADDANPAYLFSTTWTELLAKIASGEIDCQDLAKRTLAQRGVDLKGQWVGFDQAAKIHGITPDRAKHAKGAHKYARK